MIPQLVRAATREPGQPLHILLVRSEPELDVKFCRACPMGRWWGFGLPHAYWDENKFSVPRQLVLLDPALGDNQIPGDVVIDVVLAPFRPKHIEVGHQLSSSFHAPLVTLMTEDPLPTASAGRLQRARASAGQHVVVPSERSRDKWGFPAGTCVVAHHWSPQALSRAILGAISSDPFELIDYADLSRG